MAKMTLLEIVQKVLNSVSGDEVSSIGDTVEANQIANVVEDVYFNLVSNKTIPEHKELIKLTALSDTTYPNYLKLPTNVAKLVEFKYDNTTNAATIVDYKEVKYLEPEAFLKLVGSRNSLDTNVQIVTDISNGVKLLIVNDRHPEFFTSFDDEHLVCDSFDADADDTLQASKSMGFAYILPTFTIDDDFVPDMDANMFPLLLNEVKSWVHLEHRQQPHSKAEQQARRQRVTMQNDTERLDIKHSRPDYGRR